MSRPPRAFCCSNHCMIGGSVSAAFAPTSITTSACAMSATGNGRPRSMPNARFCRRRGTRHAEAAVVVDVRGAERDAGELAEQVRLLVGQRAGAEHAVGVRAVLLADREHLRGDEIERLVPRRVAPLAACVAELRRGDPLAGVEAASRRSSP